MSKQTFKRAIRMELDKLNQVIDLKIIQGLPYKRESRRHQTLMRELARINQRQGWFVRTMSFVSTFIF